MLDKISHSKTNSCQPYEGESRIPEFPDRSTSAVLCKALSPSLSASANDTAGQETLKLTTSSLFSLKQPCQAAQHPISLPKTLSLSQHTVTTHMLHTVSSQLHAAAKSQSLKCGAEELTHTLDLTNGCLKYTKGKHLLLTRQEITKPKNENAAHARKSLLI